MELKEAVQYLGAVAASDGPIDGRERDLLLHLAKDFGAEHMEAGELLAGLPPTFPTPPTLDSLSTREDALKLLRAMLVIAYCDGSLDPEEFPLVAPVVEKFAISSHDLNTLKQQAFYFLRPAPPSVGLPPEPVQAGNWDEVERLAQEQFELNRRSYFERFQSDLAGADAETCYMAMMVGAPSFDTSHVRERFLNSHPDTMMMEDHTLLRLLRDEAEKKLRSQWEAAYSSRCNSCYLEAPGKRRDACPRCGAEYGEPPRR